MRLENKVAVITGASLGIGSDIALAFAKEGAAVAVDYRSHPDEAAYVAGSIFVIDGGMMGHSGRL